MKRTYDANTMCLGCGIHLEKDECTYGGYLCNKCWAEFRRGGVVTDDDLRFLAIEIEYNAVLEPENMDD